MKKHAVLTVMLASIFLSGCVIPLPAFEQVPFDKEKLPDLDIGKSTRADVLFGLGEPDVVYGTERLFLYTKLHTHFVWLVAVAAGYQGEVAIIPGSQTRYFLGAWFDEKNRLSHLEAIPLLQPLTSYNESAEGQKKPASESGSVKNCFANGLCFANDNGTALYAPPDTAPSISRNPEKACRLYLFAHCDAACEQDSVIDPDSVRMAIDKRPVGTHVRDGYYDLHIRPGRHILSASGRKRGVFVLSEEKHREKLICEPPGPVYMRLSLSAENGEGNPFGFDVLDKETGLTVIKQRKRLLRRWRSENFPIKPIFRRY